MFYQVADTLYIHDLFELTTISHHNHGIPRGGKKDTQGGVPDSIVEGSKHRQGKRCGPMVVFYVL